jgi:secreted trypsin-like serine protease
MANTYQMGIVSFGPDECGKGVAPGENSGFILRFYPNFLSFLAVFTRVTAYLDWIKEKIDENTRKPNRS